jgi:hypothetical protein
MAATPPSYIESAISVSVVDGTAIDITTDFDVAIVADITGGSAAGDVYREYTAASAVTQAAADLTATDITQIVHDQIVAIYSQDKVPSRTTLIKLGGGTYDAAIAAAEANGYRAPWNFTYLLIDSRTAADIVDASGAAESRDLLFVAQSSDATWGTSGFPAAFSSIASNTKTLIVYEDTDGAAVDAAWVGRLAGTASDTERQSGIVRLNGLAEYSPLLTSDQRLTHLPDNRASFHQITIPGGVTRNMTGAKTLSTRTFSLAFALLWTKVRLTEALGEVLAAEIALGTELTNDEPGKDKIRAAVRSVMLTAQVPPYIGPSDTLPEAYEITSLTVSGTAAALAVRANFIEGIRTVSVSVTLV